MLESNFDNFNMACTKKFIFTTSLFISLMKSFLILISISGSSMGTVDATSTSVTALSAIEFTPTESMTAVSVVFTCTNATSAGSSHGAGIGSITIIGTPKNSGGDSSPNITLGTYSINPTSAEGDGTITVTYNNIASVDAEVKFYESDGTTPATYNWLDADINGDNNVYYT